jgi:Na+-translocating ferredoxin:NAD+ oxidoreductase RnfD subunit
MAVLLFGYKALITMVISVATAMLVEALWLRKRDIFSDGSAAVTGLLLLPWFASGSTLVAGCCRGSFINYYRQAGFWRYRLQYI